MSVSLKQCPRCARWISRKAQICPFCNAPIPTSKKAGGKTYLWWIFGGGFAMILCMVLVITSIALLQKTVGLSSFSSIATDGLTSSLEEPTVVVYENISGNLTLWYAYPSSSISENVLLEVLDNIEMENPGLQIMAENHYSSTDLLDRYNIASAAGDGPDLVISYSAQLTRMIENGTAHDIGNPEISALSFFHPSALDTVTVDGRIYGLPLSMEGVALYYNKEFIPEPPPDTESLLEYVREGKGLAVPIGAPYFLYGFWGAFGGQLFDENGHCMADQGGFASALEYLLQLQEAGADLQAEYDQGTTQLITGEIAMLINGSWMLTELHEEMGDTLGVAALPAGPTGPSSPLLNTQALIINPYSNDLDTAIQVAFLISGKEPVQLLSETTRVVPARYDIVISDPLIESLSLAFQNGSPFPNNKWMDSYWSSFDPVFTAVLSEYALPQDALIQACQDMDQYNGIP